MREEGAVMPKKKKEFWEKPNPVRRSTVLSAEQKKAAKARALRAGRPYPNLVDNSWASRKKK